MRPVVSALLAFLAACFRSRRSMQLEILALRHRVAVYQRSVPRPCIQPTDRLFWAWLTCLWAGWQNALAFVQPRTVIAWQQKRFREYWRRLSQGRTPGRPAVAKEVRELIREMSRANPTWGSPRIVGELRKVGIEVAEIHRREVPTATTQALLTDVEGVSQEPRQRPDRHGFLCRPYHDIQDPICSRHPRARAASGHPLQHH